MLPGGCGPSERNRRARKKQPQPRTGPCRLSLSFVSFVSVCRNLREGEYQRGNTGTHLREMGGEIGDIANSQDSSRFAETHRKRKKKKMENRVE